MKKQLSFSFLLLMAAVGFVGCAGNSGAATIDRSVPFGYEGVYSVSQINPHAYLINQSGQATCYLVLGEERALLIDTGVGMGDLASQVKALTDLPVMVVNTHGHLDHTGADFLFDDIWIHPLDTVLYHDYYNHESWTATVKDFVSGGGAESLGVEITDKDVEKFLSIPPAKVNLLEDGQIIDLGGHKLEVCLLGGHTAGSIMFIDRADQILYSGDAVTGWLWLWLPESLPLSEYMARCKEIRPRLDGLKTIFGGHEQSAEGVDITYVDSVMAHLESVMAGKEKSKPDTVYGTPVSIYYFDDFRLYLDVEQAAEYETTFSIHQ